MNQACEARRHLGCAGLARDRHAAAAARRPVPPVTTSRMNSPDRGRRFRTQHLLRLDRRDRCSRRSPSGPAAIVPPFATVAATRAIWNGEATTCPCPYADCGSDFLSCSGLFGAATAMPSRFAVSSNACAPTLYVPSCAK